MKTSDGNELVINSDAMEEHKEIRFTPFRKSGYSNEKIYFEIAFSSPLPVDKCFGIYFEVYDGYPIKRNDINDLKAFIPLGVIDAQVWHDDAWTSAEIISDETAGFLFNGMLLLKISAGMSAYGSDYKIRFILKNDNYDIYPVITKIKINVLRAVQEETVCIFHSAAYDGSNITDIQSSYLSENGVPDIFLCTDTENSGFVRANNIRKLNEDESEIVRFAYDVPENTDKIYSVRAVFTDKVFINKYSSYIGNGYPFQQIRLENAKIMYEGFEIIIFDSYDKVFYQWEKVSDFDLSGPESRHYNFDEQDGTITFGDSENGLAPDGEVVIISASLSSAENGNIKSGSVICDGSLLDNVSLSITDAYGGSRAETVNESFARFMRESHDKLRCVTFDDYKKEVYSVQGLMIENCNVFSTYEFMPSKTSENSITVVVQPYSETENAKINQAYIKNIQYALDKKRFIGTDIRIVCPVYVGIEVYADVVCSPYYADTRLDIERKIKDFFDNGKNVFGKRLEYDKLYFLIDTLKFVERVKSLTVSCSGRGARIRENGDIELLPDAIAYSKKILCTLTNGN